VPVIKRDLGLKACQWVALEYFFATNHGHP